MDICGTIPLAWDPDVIKGGGGDKDSVVPASPFFAC